ncbi:flavin-containing amine oxidasedehydrogenase-like protein [Usnea florida]
MSSEGLLKNGKKKVVIVGGGAAGMSCAATLAQHPDKYKVTLIERMSVVGGQATSIPLDQDKYGTSWMNDGVQGGSPVFKHTFNFFKRYGHEPKDVKLQVAFGKGKDGFWTNCFPSNLVDQFSGDIQKFGKVLKLIKWTMPVLGIIPIRIMLRMFFFSKDFGDKMVFPLIALFLGTGNQTANVSCAILERLFDDPNMKLWDYDPETLLPNLPLMVTFPHLEKFYGQWADDLKSQGVDIRTNTDVTEIVSRSKKGVVLKTAPFDPEKGKTDSGQRAGGHTGPESTTETFDNLVMCVLADDAKKLLGRTATWREKFVLGGARFFDDITITHSDSKYFQDNYETHFNPELCAKPKNKQQEDQVAFAKNEKKGQDGEPSGYRPMYYTHSYPEDMQKIEMAFDCTNYQHQFRMDHDADKAPIPYDNHVFQSIFLDKTHSDLWTIDQIDESKIIERKWWHQLGHRWQHYVRVVPGMMFINGKNNTFFAGSWTLVNMHEMACVSGIAAAYRLGADYERFDDFAEDLFKKYLWISHGVRYKGGKKVQ